MDLVTRLFDRLDDWRHLPNYQLERLTYCKKMVL